MAHTHRIATVAALLFVSLPARGQSPSLKPDSIRLAGRHYVADLTDGGHADLTLDPRLQTSTDDVLRTFQIPYAGAVVISIPDGRVLAMVGRSAADPRLGPADAGAAPLGPVGLRVQGRLGDRARRERRLGRDAHLLPRRRLVDPARQPDRHPGHRPQLRHAGLRDRQVPERHRRQAGHHASDRRRSRPRGAQLRLRRGDSVRAPHRAVAPGRAREQQAGDGARLGRLLALDAVADARRAAGGDHRQRAARCPPRR